MEAWPQPSALALPRRTLVTLPFFARLRFQLPLVVIVCAVLPALILAGPDALQPLPFSPASNAFWAALLSSVGGLLLFRRLGTFPGITSFGQVTPSVAGPYLLAVGVILLARLDYSRPLLLASGVITVGLFYSLWLYCRRRCVPTIYALPGTRLRAPHVQMRAARLDLAPTRFERHAIIVANLHTDLDPAWDDYILRAALAGVPVYHAKQLEESLLGKVEIEHLSENSFGSLSPDQFYMRAKRAVDLTIALLALPLLVALLAIVGLAIKLDSPGPIFFRQTRMGYRGRPFQVVKFRSMHHGPIVGSLRESAKTQDRDPRITRVGRILRRYRLDELPQVINILRGEMSWIGPRPEARELSDWYHSEIPFYGYRHIVRPGITGWAQVHQGHVHDVNAVVEKLQFDFYYIKYFSAWLDLLIVLRTVRTLLVGNGAK
jgi:lipopolysaccharide/colanic/teichoic acid biosynthesis glycosyltransferase